MDWQIKSAAFRALARVPVGQSLHYFGQRHLMRTCPRSDSAYKALWDKATKFLEVAGPRDFSVPLALRFQGATHVEALDITRLAKFDLMRISAARMAAMAHQPVPRLATWNDVTNFGDYLAPMTSSQLAIEPATIDLICSNEVLEYVSPDHLRQLAASARRLLKADGLMVRAIDFTDHFARTDAKINRFNFLRFDDTSRPPHNSSFQYVNRLPPRDYERIFHQAGFAIAGRHVEIGTPTSTGLGDIAPQFSRDPEGRSICVEWATCTSTDLSEDLRNIG